MTAAKINVKAAPKHTILLLLLLAGLFVLATDALAVGPKCDGGYAVRREFRDLSEPEWQDLIAAIKELQRRPSTKYSEMSKYDEFGKLHQELFDKIHGVPKFLSWHRLFLYKFETELRKINKNLAVPYWGQMIDYANPEQSYLWSGERLGGSNPVDEKMTAGCIPNGPFHDMHGAFGCIKRGFSPDGRIAPDHVKLIVDDYIVGPGAWKSSGENGAWKVRFPSGQELFAVVRDNPNFSAFADVMEYNVHPIGHLFTSSLRGTMSERFSPYDPVFWVHHSFIDKIFDSWQRLHKDRPYINDNLDSYGVTAREVDSLDDLCVRYLEPGALNPPSPKSQPKPQPQPEPQPEPPKPQPHPQPTFVVDPPKVTTTTAVAPEPKSSTASRAPASETTTTTTKATDPATNTQKQDVTVTSKKDELSTTKKDGMQTTSDDKPVSVTISTAKHADQTATPTTMAKKPIDTPSASKLPSLTTTSSALPSKAPSKSSDTATTTQPPNFGTTTHVPEPSTPTTKLDDPVPPAYGRKKPIDDDKTKHGNKTEPVHEPVDDSKPPAYGKEPAVDVKPPVYGKPVDDVQPPTLGKKPVDDNKPPAYGKKPINDVKKPVVGGDEPADGRRIHPPHYDKEPVDDLKMAEDTQPPQYGKKLAHDVPVNQPGNSPVDDVPSGGNKTVDTPGRDRPAYSKKPTSTPAASSTAIDPGPHPTQIVDVSAVQEPGKPLDGKQYLQPPCPIVLPAVKGYPQVSTKYPAFIVAPVPPADRALLQMPESFVRMMRYNETRVRAVEKEFRDAVVQPIQEQVKQGLFQPAYGMSAETRKALQTVHQQDLALRQADMASGAAAGSKAASAALAVAVMFYAVFV